MHPQDQALLINPAAKDSKRTSALCIFIMFVVEKSKGYGEIGCQLAFAVDFIPLSTFSQAVLKALFMPTTVTYFSRSTRPSLFQNDLGLAVGVTNKI